MPTADSSMMMAKGRALAIAMLCSAVRPPASSSTEASTPLRMAQLPGRCIQCPAGGQGVDHQCPGIRRGDEEQGDQQYCEEGRHRSEGELLQQLEQGDGVVRLHLINQFAVALVDDQVQCGVTEYRSEE